VQEGEGRDDGRRDRDAAMRRQRRKEGQGKLHFGQTTVTGLAVAVS
jgi:hypothetical protein